MRKLRSWIIPLLLLIVVLYPGTRVWVMRGLMKIGFFKPTMAAPAPNSNDFSSVAFMDESGRSFTLGSLKGKVVLINFWATWCPPCVAEMPSLQAVYERWKSNPGFVFLAVDSDGNLVKANQFLLKKDYSFRAVAQASAIPSGMAGNSLPETIILDKTGKLVFRHVGMANYDSNSFHERLEELLGR